MTALETKFSKSALSDEVKEFLKQHKDKQGSFNYVEQIDQMMPKSARYIVVDYNDLVSHPQIESKFNENPDEILAAFARAIKEILQERFPQYATKIKEEIRDRIVLTGIVRIEQEYFVGARSTSGLYRLRIDGNNIEFLGGRGPKTSRKTEREEVSPEEEKIIKSLSGNPDIYNRLVDSFAPHIQGHTLIKEAILLLIVGSTQRLLQDGTKIRGDINIFLVGDPGTAKSEMLKFCARIAPRGLYTSGRGSTAAGLTAAVVRDKSGIMMLEAGAVVLGDQGLVCIDEFDKMKPEDRSALHEVMEQQSASIAKGGIVATLNARTSILAAANPMYGKYDPFKNITENVNLPIPLLTRFDLIFVVRDIPSKEKDSRIAKHIINLYTPGGNDTRSLIDSDI